MDTGAIIGIVVGSIVLITLLFCLLAQTTGGGETKIIETGAERSVFPGYPEYPPPAPMSTYPRPLPPPIYPASPVLASGYPQPPPMAYQMGSPLERGMVMYR